MIKLVFYFFIINLIKKLKKKTENMDQEDQDIDNSEIALLMV